MIEWNERLGPCPDGWQRLSIEEQKKVISEAWIKFAEGTNAGTEFHGYPWLWSSRLGNGEVKEQAKELEVRPLFGEPVRPGDLYLAKRNTGFRLLTCDWLGAACVFPEGIAYAFDFSEVVKVVEE